MSERIFKELLSIATTRIIESDYEKDYGYEPDFNNDDTYTKYVEDVIDDFDFDDFATSYDMLFWGQSGLTPDDYELHSGDTISELAHYLETKLTDISDAFTNEDMTADAKKLFDEQVKKKLESAGYKFVDLVEAVVTSETETIVTERVPVNDFPEEFDIKDKNKFEAVIDKSIQSFEKALQNNNVDRISLVILDDGSNELKVIKNDTTSIGGYYVSGNVSGMVIVISEKK